MERMIRIASWLVELLFVALVVLLSGIGEKTLEDVGFLKTAKMFIIPITTFSIAMMILMWPPRAPIWSDIFWKKPQRFEWTLTRRQVLQLCLLLGFGAFLIFYLWATIKANIVARSLTVAAVTFVILRLAERLSLARLAKRVKLEEKVKRNS